MVTATYPKAQALMAKEGIQLLLALPVVDILYLAGLHTHAADRLTVLILPVTGQPVLLTPELEASFYQAQESDTVIAAWKETDNPVAALQTLVNGFAQAGHTIAVSSYMNAEVLLSLLEHMPNYQYVSAKPILSNLRVTKSIEEIQALRRAAELTDSALAEFWHGTRIQGSTARQIKARLGLLLQEAGLEPDRPVFVVTGSETGHIRQRNMDRPVEQGDVLLLDPGGGCQHYISDITRMACVGPPATEFERIYGVVRQAQELACAAVAPGVSCEHIDRVARQHIDAAGYGPYFTHRVGHGLGLEGHEPPFLVEGNAMLLRPNMVMTVEPGIYLPGRFGARIEDMLVVTEQGAEVLTSASHELRIVE